MPVSRGASRSLGATRPRCASRAGGEGRTALRGRRGPAGTLARPASVAQWKSDSVLRSRLGVRVPPGAPQCAIGIPPPLLRSTPRSGTAQRSGLCLSRRRRFQSSTVLPGWELLSGRDARPQSLLMGPRQRGAAGPSGTALNGAARTSPGIGGAVDAERERGRRRDHHCRGRRRSSRGSALRSSAHTEVPRRSAPARCCGPRRPRPEPRRPAGRVREQLARGIQCAARVGRSHGGRLQAVAAGARDPLPRLDVAGRPPPAVRARSARTGGVRGGDPGATSASVTAHGLLRASRGSSPRLPRHDRGWYSTEGSL